MNVISRGIRNAFRNLTRTIAIIVILGLSMGLSTVMLVAHQAVEDKIQTVKHSIGNAITIHPAGFDAFSSANNALTVSQLEKVKKIGHVTKVAELLAGHLQTIGTSVLGNVGTNDNTNLTSPSKLNKSSSDGTDSYSGAGLTIFRPSDKKLPTNVSLPVSIVGSTNPTDPTTADATSLKLVSGKVIDGTKDTDEAMVSTAMAAKNNLHLGSTFSAYGKTLKVVGIFNTDTDSGNNYVIVSLPTQQRLSGQQGIVTRAYAIVDSLDNLNSTTSAIKKALGSAADVTALTDQANQALRPLASVGNLSLYSLLGAVATGAIIILMTMIMIVRERRREIGILKAIGAGNRRIIIQFMVEALTLTLIGAIVGLVIGVFAGRPVTSLLVGATGNASSSTSVGIGGSGIPGAGAGIKNIQTEIGWTVFVFGLGAAMLIAITGSALASYLIARVRPAEVMRSE
jgi:putative ABC transport system permease protein